MYKKCEEILNKLQHEGKIKISNYQFPTKQELKLKLSDLLESDVPEKYYLSDEIINKITYEDSQDDKTFHIKNCTKKGYLEAENGDGCYIQNIDKKRGTVQKNKIPTLKTSPDVGVVVDK